jgi:hypothetical protein
MPFSFGEAFSQGSNTFKTRYGSLLGATAVFILVMIGIGIAQLVLDTVFGHADSNDPTLSDLLITVFVSNVFGPGLFLYAVQLHRGQSPGLGTLFAGFSRYWPMVGIGVLVSLIFGGIALGMAFFAGLGFAVSSIGSAPDLSLGAGFAIAVLVAVCLSLFFATRLAFVSVLCIDPERQYGVTESFAASWRMTGPIFWPLLGLIIVLSLILTASLLLLVLPVIFVGIPLFTVVLAAAYQLALGEAPAADDRGEVFTQG